MIKEHTRTNMLEAVVPNIGNAFVKDLEDWKKVISSRLEDFPKSNSRPYSGKYVTFKYKNSNHSIPVREYQKYITETDITLFSKINEVFEEHENIDLLTDERKRKDYKQQKSEKYFEDSEISYNSLGANHKPTIYKITNKVTGKFYIGKTVCKIGKRWNEHLYYSHNSNTELHVSIRENYVTDWVFEILEEIQIPNDLKTDRQIHKYILSRERYHIDLHNAVKEGYNMV